MRIIGKPSGMVVRCACSTHRQIVCNTIIAFILSKVKDFSVQSTAALSSPQGFQVSGPQGVCPVHKDFQVSSPQGFCFPIHKDIKCPVHKDSVLTKGSKCPVQKHNGDLRGLLECATHGLCLVGPQGFLSPNAQEFRFLPDPPCKRVISWPRRIWFLQKAFWITGISRRSG